MPRAALLCCGGADALAGLEAAAGTGDEGARDVPGRAAEKVSAEDSG